MVRRKLAQCAVTALAATTLTALPAVAATGYTPEGVCGSGFGRVTDGTRAVVDDNGTVFGHVYLLYNARTGENCTVTIKSKYVGEPTWTGVNLIRQGLDKPQDAGYYKYYAGPVKAYGKGRCVAFQGLVSGMRAGEKFTASTPVGLGERKAWGNCA
ncbi:hypothetical protein AB0B45_38420 [Nonomuraea sp. NPDC049152]|uniref:hypothetical protein n=1 Tax=Nonomuraea sp. NPDC049152 TaxID=3154350 RepID=UPI0033F825FC